MSTPGSRASDHRVAILAELDQLRQMVENSISEKQTFTLVYRLLLVRKSVTSVLSRFSEGAQHDDK